MGLHSVSVRGCSAEKARFCCGYSEPVTKMDEYRFFFFFNYLKKKKKKKRRQKFQSSTVRGLHADTPSLMKGSVLRRLPPRTLQTFLRWSKVCGCPHSQSSVSKIIFFFFSFFFLFLFITLSGRNFSHTKGASEPVK